MTTEYVNRHEQETHRVMIESCGRRLPCISEWGDVLCESCDAVLASEGTPMRLGDKCWRCAAVIVAFEPVRQESAT